MDNNIHIHNIDFIDNPIINYGSTNNTRIKKQRLFLELEYLESVYKVVILRMVHNKETEIDVKYPIQESIPKELTIIIPKDYPFKSPDVLVHTNKQYLQTIDYCHIPRIRNIIIKNNKNNKKDLINISENPDPVCLKCKSIICIDNWSPALKIKNILHEIGDHNKLKRIVSIEIGLEDIFNKYKRLSEEIIDLIKEYL